MALAFCFVGYVWKITISKNVPLGSITIDKLSWSLLRLKKSHILSSAKFLAFSCWESVSRTIFRTFKEAFRLMNCLHKSQIVDGSWSYSTHAFSILVNLHEFGFGAFRNHSKKEEQVEGWMSALHHFMFHIVRVSELR